MEELYAEWQDDKGDDRLCGRNDRSDGGGYPGTRDIKYGPMGRLKVGGQYVPFEKGNIQKAQNGRE